MRSLAEDAAGIEEVADALGRPVAWLQRHWLKIHREHGFPRRHPTGWTWPRGAVAAWLAAGGFAPRRLEPANDALPVADPEAAYMANLNRAYGVEA